jgi:hypothetical protein
MAAGAFSVASIVGTDITLTGIVLVSRRLDRRPIMEDEKRKCSVVIIVVVLELQLANGSAALNMVAYRVRPRARMIC